jgi:hypothetical protein
MRPRRVPGRPTFIQTRERYLRMVRGLGENFTKPDDDWAAVLFLETPTGTQIVAVDPAYLASEEAKERFALEVLPSFISEQRAYRVGMVVSAWFTSYELPAGMNMELPPTLQTPGRKEVVSVQVADLAHQELWWAQINRSSTAPPQLGEWEQLEADLMGRFAVSLRRAFRPQG